MSKARYSPSTSTWCLVVVSENKREVISHKDKKKEDIIFSNKFLRERLCPVAGRLTSDRSPSEKNSQKEPGDVLYFKKVYHLLICKNHQFL